MISSSSKGIISFCPQSSVHATSFNLLICSYISYNCIVINEIFKAEDSGKKDAMPSADTEQNLSVILTMRSM